MIHRHSLLYRVYLRSPLWRARRYFWWLMANGRCECCGEPCPLHGAGAITVHHRSYARLGHERRGDVQLLCWRCHRRIDSWRYR
jgi:5-methylcytosine-specific restriction endonuclease McrA